MLETILFALGCLAVAVVVIAILNIDEIKAWFENWQKENEVDYDDVGFAIKENLEKGDVRVVQGIFNKSSGQVKEARRIKAEDIDKKTKNILGKEPLTIFN